MRKCHAQSGIPTWACCASWLNPGHSISMGFAAVSAFVLVFLRGEFVLQKLPASFDCLLSLGLINHYFSGPEIWS